VLTRSDVAHLAHLARLAVTDEELDRYVGQLSVILESVAVVSEVVAGGAVATRWQAPGSGDPSEQLGAISEVAPDDIEPTSHAVPLTNVYREDVVIRGLTREQALAMAPATEDGRFRVPQILGEQ
jgi:aspartyl-tRNA(Asn)/glutamyl-tRNA(Gln) amidotransferase subunit C